MTYLLSLSAASSYPRDRTTDMTDWRDMWGLMVARIRVVLKNCGKGVTRKRQVKSNKDLGIVFASKMKISLRILEGKLLVQQQNIASSDCCMTGASYATSAKK